MTPSDDEPPLWLQILRSTAERRGLSRREVAEQTGIGLGKLQRIWNRHTRPSADDALRLCEALDLPKERMLAELGYLARMSDREAYIDQLEELASRVSYAAGHVEVEQLHGSAVIAARILATGRYRVTCAPLFNGSGRFRRHVSDLIAVQPIDAADAVGLRDRLEAILRAELAWFQGGFIALPQTAAALNLPTTDHAAVIELARMNGIRRGTGSPLAPRPRSICVVGSHWAGSADVGSWLAYAFDLDFCHIGFVASRHFARLLHREHDLNAYEREEVARTYAVGAERLGRRRVWAVGGDNCMHTLELLTDPRLVREPHVVYLRAEDDLMEWAARVRFLFKHQTTRTIAEDFEVMKAERRQFDLVLGRHARLRARTIVLPIALPVGPNFDDNGVDGRNEFYDVYGEMAEKALMGLHATVAANSRDDVSFDLDEGMRRMHTGGVPHA